MRTLPNIQTLMQRLDTVIDNFIKSLLNGYNFSDLERIWFSLPTKMGGLGIKIPSELCDVYYNNSKAVTATLVQRIVNQFGTRTEEEEDNSRSVKAEIKREKLAREEARFELVKSQIDIQKQKILEATIENRGLKLVELFTLVEEPQLSFE